MENAVILKTGKVVRKSSFIPGSLFIDLQDGLVTEFAIGASDKIYTHVTKDKYGDQKPISAGYYLESEFLKYLASTINLEKLNQFILKDSDLILAKDDDHVEVSRLYVKSPYTSFYKLEKFVFNYKKNVDILDFNHNVIIPSGVTPTVGTVTNNQIHHDALGFYTNRISLVSHFSTAEKDSAALLITKIGLVINMICFDIFPLFNTASDNTNLNSYIINQTNEWETGNILAEHTLEALTEFCENLLTYYKAAYANQLKILNASGKEKLYWLARGLSVEGLSVVPVADKITLLKSISGFRKDLTENNKGEELVIKIVESLTMDSVSGANRNLFLKELMENQVYDVNYNGHDVSLDQHKTLFEILYRKIDDNRAARYDLYGSKYIFGLISAQDNRKKFILMLYKIWKSSEYNPHYADPSYTQPANVFGVYPQSYYMKLITDTGSSIALTAFYNPETSPAVLVYSSVNTNSSIGSTNYSMQTESMGYILGDIKGKKIEIRKQKTISRVESTDDGPLAYSVSGEPILYGTYDLYQPISILGFKPDLDLVETFKDPETGVNVNDPTPNIPVFFLYYMQDYSDLKKLDFGIMFVVNVATNLTGVGALNDLKYFSYLSKIRSIKTATATEVVFFWKAVAGVNSAVQFTADNLSAIKDYVENTTNDPETKEFTEAVAVWFRIVTIVNLGVDTLMKDRLIVATAQVLEEERILISSGKSHGLDVNAMNAIRAAYDIDPLIALMQSKLNHLPAHANDNILSRFTNFTKEEKYDFFTYFYNVKEDSSIWIDLNFLHSRSVNGSTDQYTLLDIWKNEIQYLKNRRTVEFLEGFDKVRNDSDLLKHVHEGDFEIKLRGGNAIIGEPKIVGSHNMNVIRSTPVTSNNPLNAGEIYWTDPPPKYSKPMDILNSYQQGKIQRNMSDLTDPHTGLPFVKGNGSSIATKKGENVYFPISYSTERINEEMAYALSQIDRSRPFDTIIGADGSYSFFYRGRASDGHFLEIIYLSTTSNKNTAILQTIYPINF